MLAGETKQILGENPQALFMVEGFVNSDYDTFNNNFHAVIVIFLLWWYPKQELFVFQQQLEVDAYISANKTILSEIILEKAIKQVIIYWIRV